MKNQYIPVKSTLELNARGESADKTVHYVPLADLEAFVASGATEGTVVIPEEYMGVAGRHNCVYEMTLAGNPDAEDFVLDARWRLIADVNGTEVHLFLIGTENALQGIEPVSVEGAVSE